MPHRAQLGIGWSIVSQRPQDVHTKVRNQVGTLFALRTLGTHERKAIAEWVSDKARTKDELRIVDRLPELETGVAQVWSPSFLKTTTTVRVAQKTTFDSSKTPEFGVAALEPKTLADVDLHGLRARMTASIEHAQADNPHELRRRIAHLERELQARTTNHKPHIERVVERVEVPVVPPDDWLPCAASPSRWSRRQRSSRARPRRFVARWRRRRSCSTVCLHQHQRVCRRSNRRRCLCRARMVPSLRRMECCRWPSARS